MSVKDCVIPCYLQVNIFLPKVLKTKIEFFPFFSILASDVSVDWIVTIQKDGTAILWKLKGLSNQPRSTVSSSLYFRFHVNSKWEFPATLIALGNQTGTFSPTNMKFYALDMSGSVSLWKVENSGHSK